MRHPDPHFGYPTVSWRTSGPRATPSAPSSASHRFLRQGTLVLDTHVDAIDLSSAAQRILNWGSRHQSRCVALCSMDVLVQATRDTPLHHSLAEVDLALAADAGVAWTMRREGQRHQQALHAQDILWSHLALAEQAGQPVHFHGGTPASLEGLLARVRTAFPALSVTGTASPPQPGTPAEDLALVHQITSTGAPVVFLGLPHAEQAQWMSSHRGRLPAVMVGLGPDFGLPDASPPRVGIRPGIGRWFSTRAVFFSRVAQSLLLGTPASHPDDKRP